MWTPAGSARSRLIPSSPSGRGGAFVLSRGLASAAAAPSSSLKALVFSLGSDSGLLLFEGTGSFFFLSGGKLASEH